MYKIFIDGHAGTTGLQIHQRLQGRSDIELLHISDADRKNADAKRQIIETADVVILCLPDQAAIETVNFPEPEILSCSRCYGISGNSLECNCRLRLARSVTSPDSRNGASPSREEGTEGRN